MADTMAISEKELKLLMNFLKDDLKEILEKKELDEKDGLVKKILDNIQQYLED
jgi:hypothetical protein